MKFLCDRCKTRYSIGDERVRGKILKIRCKNCNNVITVREGMPEVADAPVAGRQRTATQAVPVASEGGALGAAFASAMTKPPPALEEEWYVSIDGEQAGPFSLTDAQRWVSSKPHDADLHCWSEGFDDWLPVDKVSHFRGLRKKPAPPPLPAAPPPVPRAATGAVRSVNRSGPVAAPAPEEEPRPLFAATMASIEKGVAHEPFGIPSIRGATLPSATPALGHTAMPAAARTNGAVTPVPVRTPVRTPVPSVVAKPGPAMPAALDPSVSATQIGAPPIDVGDEADSPPLPTATNDPFVQARGRMPADGASAPSAEPWEGDDDLDIGEVSRVVNLADLMRSERAAKAGKAEKAEKAEPPRRPSGAIANRTGGIGRISTSAIAIPGPGAPGAQLDPGALDPNAPAPAMVAAVEVSHRRGMIALMVGALLLLGVAGAVVILVMSGDDGISSGLGKVGDIDTTRPDDPIRRTGSAAVIAVETPQNPFVPKKPIYKPPTNTTNPINTPPDAKALRADEIEEMAAKYSGTTQRCYIRSQRGADAILIGDVRKIGVTLTVDKAGTVTNVELTQHAANSLGKCLISSIKGWKFRASSSGITAKITMVFQSG